MAVFNTVVSLLGYSVVLLSTVQKLPQLAQVFTAGRAESLSIASIQLDTLAYTIAASYGYLHYLSLYVYGEMIILLAQSVTLFLLVAHYSNMLSNVRMLLVIGIYSLWIICIILRWIPEFVLTIQLLLSIPVSAGSKLSQIWKLHQRKRAGQVNPYLYAISAYGCFIRIITTALEVENNIILFNYSLSAVLNLVIIILIIKYREKTIELKE